MSHYRMVAESDDYCDAALEADSSETASDDEVAGVRDYILGHVTRTDVPAPTAALVDDLRDEAAL